MDNRAIAQRVSYWRVRRGLTQPIFAGRLGRSLSWVKKVEAGDRQLDRLSVLEQIADVLQVDLQVLIGQELKRDNTNCIDDTEVEAIRGALERTNATTGWLRGDNTDAGVPDVLALRRRVTHAWSAFEMARYGVLGQILPALLQETQGALTTSPTGTDRSLDSARLLAQSYLITASALRKLGEHELGWLAADRAMTAAERAQSPLLAGVATYRAANAMLALGRPDAARQLNLDMADRLAPAGGPTSPAQLSVHGILLLQAAMAAARAGDHTATASLLAAAGEVADRTGDRNDCWTSFGPTNVAIHQVAAHVELGDGPPAVAAAAAVPPDRIRALNAERRANHYLDIARGHSQAGQPALATSLLLQAEQLAPAEIRCRPIARAVIGDVLRRSPTAPAPLRGLAARAGVPA